MKNKPIIIVAGEPNSIFLEIFFKSIKSKKFKNPIILICSLNLLKLQMSKLKFKKKIKLINSNKSNLTKLNNKTINLIDVQYNQKTAFEKISKKSKNYIKKSFDIAFEIIKRGLSNKLINGPISKKHFLDKKFFGITEYIANNFSSKNEVMLIYNKKISVSPITTHLPIKSVSQNIDKELINRKVKIINNFYKYYFKKVPRIGLTGLNPHCESNLKKNEEKQIIEPSIKKLRKQGLKIYGPYAADTIFLKKNRELFDVVVGMYHDQVLGPLKTLYEYDAINITLGLPFIRISPDHGPNERMLGKNKSNPLSLINAISFLDKN